VDGPLADIARAVCISRQPYFAFGRVQQDQTPTLKEDGRVVTYDMMTSYFFSALASLAGGGFMPTVNWRIFKAPPSRMSMAPQNTVTLVASPLLGSLPKMSVSPLATTRSLLMTTCCRL
jgi:hypothetical protein